MSLTIYFGKKCLVDDLFLISTGEEATLCKKPKTFLKGRIKKIGIFENGPIFWDVFGRLGKNRWRGQQA